MIATSGCEHETSTMPGGPSKYQLDELIEWSFVWSQPKCVAVTQSPKYLSYSPSVHTDPNAYYNALVVDIRGHFSPAFPQVLHEFTHEPTIHAHILHIFSVMLNTADRRRYSMYLGGYWAPPRVDKWGGHAIASTPPAGFARWQPPDAKEHGHVLSKRLQVTEAGASATSAVNLPPALLPSSNHNLTG